MFQEFPPNQRWPVKGTKLTAKKVLPTLAYPGFTNIIEDALKSIVPGAEYTVKKCEVFSSWVKIELEELEGEDRFFHLSFFEWDSKKECSIEEMNAWRDKYLSYDISKNS